MTIWHICHIIDKGEIVIKFEVIFYEKENGKKPVEEFVGKQEPKMQAKIIGLLDVLKEKEII
ncbi:MAG: hypothetical protein IJZ53_13565 [Tyzzerella sp.]|nr:hypothetical protein [Tyzzerella sp.]